MTAIAQQLDEKLSSMAPATASAVERLVRDALALAQAGTPAPANGLELAEHRAFLSKIAGALAGEQFERPPQGRLEVREAW